ncbi:hypothetical protein L1D19_24455 [Vibrio natriegens]|uniref:hypothetical protein n=1 Tax=Vibrio natriegens TaxID=691 RepID=UPI001EFE9D10|nr:hypothetical protein [Vibrio natriegens]MCG9703218.1 hypothetical protein [Vibrio natriegens]
MLSSQTERKVNGPELSKQIFGGVLDYDGAGHYPGLELLNIVYGTVDEILLPEEGLVSVKKKAHDFARRLVWDEAFTDESVKQKVLYDTETEDAVRQLLSCLQLPIPSTNKIPGWERAHFFPFTRSLIHWDARKRGEKIKVERRYLRGGGALAFHVLRKDHDPNRLNRCRAGFSALFADNDNSALEKLAQTLLNQGYVDSIGSEDQVEADSVAFNDSDEDVFRDGIVNILEHYELSAVARIKALMNWTAFWLLLVQHRRSSSYLQARPSVLICDCGASHAQLRRASQRCLKEVEGTIMGAIDKAVEGRELKAQQRNKLRSFFWSTAATIKLLNAWRGRRHFTVGLELAETLVLAALNKSAEMPYEEFVDKWLYEKCKLVIGRKAAEKSGLLESFDSSVFEDNEDHFAIQMKAAGLLTEYSDATRMVGTGGLL